MEPFREEFLAIFNRIDFNQVKDHPNILIAANFWEEERFDAAKVCYRFMRSIDDLIDDYKANHGDIAPNERAKFRESVEIWLRMFMTSADHSPLREELLHTIRRFRLPVWPLKAFAESMVYDINNSGFSTIETFLKYATGASVAPASIFVHLSGLIHRNGIYRKPVFDVKNAATPCAIFSYLVHIIRDFQKDQLNNLDYFAGDLVLKHGLTRHKLRAIAEGAAITPNFRELMREYTGLAAQYKSDTWSVLQEIKPLLQPRYQLSLEIIFSLYLMIFDKIDIDNGKFTAEELNPTPEETREQVLSVIRQFTPA